MPADWIPFGLATATLVVCCSVPACCRGPYSVDSCERWTRGRASNRWWACRGDSKQYVERADRHQKSPCKKRLLRISATSQKRTILLCTLPGPWSSALFFAGGRATLVLSPPRGRPSYDPPSAAPPFGGADGEASSSVD
jgi:hypothetical protein